MPATGPIRSPTAAGINAQVIAFLRPVTRRVLGSGHTMGGVARSQPGEIWATGSQGTTGGFTAQGNMGYR